MLTAQVHLTLPAWVHDAVDMQATFATDDDKMALAIALARSNIEHRSGGPFGAAIFGPDDRVIGVGVNRVVPQQCSLAHGEIMAFMTAQQRTQRARLNRDHDGNVIGPITLATSGQPCCQCYGASVWAGIDRLLISANANDIETLAGFDEGPLPENWIGELNRRGIEVRVDVLREQGCDALRAYRDSGGITY